MDLGPGVRLSLLLSCWDLLGSLSILEGVNPFTVGQQGGEAGAVLGVLMLEVGGLDQEGECWKEIRRES